MAGGFSIYYANAILNKSFKGTDYTLPTTLYVALSTLTVDTQLRANNIASALEVAGGSGYLRMPITQANWSTSTSGESTITIDIIFPTSTGPWGTCVYAMVMDTEPRATGNILCFGALSVPAVMQNGDVLRIPANSLIVTA